MGKPALSKGRVWGARVSQELPSDSTNNVSRPLAGSRLDGGDCLTAPTLWGTGQKGKHRVRKTKGASAPRPRLEGGSHPAPGKHPTGTGRTKNMVRDGLAPEQLCRPQSQSYHVVQPSKVPSSFGALTWREHRGRSAARRNN